MAEKDPEMLEVVRCKRCGHREYYGMLTWVDGPVCRECAYDIWKVNSEFTWAPGHKDYTFPIYSDGIDYTKEDQNA